MVAKHPFSIRIELADSGENRRYCWSIYEKGNVLANSPHSYATKREATADAERRAEIIMANFRRKA
jgi:hypothetical protein